MRFLLQSSAIALVSILIAGCAGQPGGSTLAGDASQPQLAAAPLPSYKPGQTFIYSDGRVQRLVEQTADGLVWANRRGRTHLASRNMVVPRLSRETATAKIDNRVFGLPDGLWPLEVGAQTTFRTAKTTLSKDNDQRINDTRLWKCSVPGTASITVPAGTFDTYKVVCEKQGGKRDTVSQVTTWYYAPDLGHYVRRDVAKLQRGTKSKIELVAALSKKHATKKRIRKIVKGLGE